MGWAKSLVAVAVVALMAAAACTRLNPDAIGGGGGGDDMALPSTICDPAKLASDPRHCGGCDNDCAALPNVDGARVGCVGGMCNVGGACLAGFGDCTSAPGCETDFTTPAHCGSCATACGGPSPFCGADGNGGHQCSSSCGAATLCNGQCVNTTNDPQNCGGCATGCALHDHAAPVCIGGQCDFVCETGWVKTATGCVAGSGGNGGGGGGGGGLGGSGGGGGGGGPQCGMVGANCTQPSDCCSNTCLIAVCL